MDNIINNLKYSSHSAVIEYNESLWRKKEKYRPDIDGLRAIAVLCVVTFHLFPNLLQGGFVGVDIFFVISGYLISSIIHSDLVKNEFSFLSFYIRRIVRIFPALVVVLIFSLISGWNILFPDEIKELGKHIASSSLFISNIFLQHESGYFNLDGNLKPTLHLWSLGVEEQFYIVWPFILCLARKNYNGFIFYISLIFILSFSLNIYQSHIDPISDFYSIQTRTWEFVLGGLISFFKTYHTRNFSGNTEIFYFFNKKTTDDISVLGIFLILGAAIFYSKNDIFPGYLAFIPVAGAALLILSGENAFINKHVLSKKFLVNIGLVSFPIYLWHWPLQVFWRIEENHEPDVFSRICIALLSAFLAYLTYKFIEKPIRYGNFKTAKALCLTVVMAVIGITGYNIHLTGINEKLINNKFITDLYETPELYSYFDYKSVLRDGACHSVKMDSYIKNGCVDLRDKNILIWGDSYAASLYPGLNYIRNKYYKNVGLIQLTDGNGPPFFLRATTDGGEDLYDKNILKLNFLKKIHPDLILLAWMTGGKNAPSQNKDIADHLNETFIKIKKTWPSANIIVFGPFPRWEGTLRKQIIINYKYTHTTPVYMSFGLIEKDKSTDRFLLEQLDHTDLNSHNNVRYLSVQNSMCNASGCLTRTSDSVKGLTAVDWGHLTENGSIYLITQNRQKIFGNL